jgi:hypothetical protein
MSQSEFVRYAGVSRQAISKALKTGLIPSTKIDGKLRIDTSNHQVKKYLENKKIKSLSPKKAKKTKPRQSLKTENKENIETGQSLDEKQIPKYIKTLSDSGNLIYEHLVSLAKSDFDKLKIYEQIKQIRVKTQIQEGQVISRKLIKILFGKLYEIDRNEFLQIKSKIIPDIAGLFGCTDSEKMIAAEKIVDEELYKTLKHIKIEIDKFLLKMGEEKI